tara:strand:+ start:1248 stop:1448 length:201 start_codon:yes stop_codon:yes gene_type:complete
MLIAINHGTEIKIKIMKPEVIQKSFKKFFFFIIEKDIKGNIINIKIIGPLIKIPSAKEIQKVNFSR